MQIASPSVSGNGAAVKSVGSPNAPLPCPTPSATKPQQHRNHDVHEQHRRGQEPHQQSTPQLQVGIVHSLKELRPECGRLVSVITRRACAVSQCSFI